MTPKHPVDEVFASVRERAIKIHDLLTDGRHDVCKKADTYDESEKVFIACLAFVAARRSRA